MILALLFAFGIVSIVNADIRKKIDSFDETRIIRSVNQKIGDLAQFNFTKNIGEKNSINYLLYASSHLMKNNAYTKDFVEIKIDGEIYKINVTKNIDYKDTDHGLYAISTTAQFTDESIKALKTASKVTLRFHRENGFTDVVQLPDNVLAEWKEVISTEK